MKSWALGMVAVIVIELGLIGAELFSHGEGVFDLFRASAASMPPERPIGFGPRLSGFAAELEEAVGCYQGDCGFPHSSDDEYRLAVGENLRGVLHELRDWTEKNRVRDVRVSDLAAVYLRTSDPRVQDAALDVLRAQPAREENLDAILTALSQGIDDGVAQRARDELRRYRSPADQARISAFLASVAQAQR